MLDWAKPYQNSLSSLVNICILSQFRPDWLAQLDYFFVLNQAMAQIVLWQQTGINITVAVNISACKLLLPDFSSEVFCLLEHHSLHGEQLELEITEGVMILNVERTIVELNKLFAAKANLTIDDFGNDYSPL